MHCIAALLPRALTVSAALRLPQASQDLEPSKFFFLEAVRARVALSSSLAAEYESQFQHCVAAICRQGLREPNKLQPSVTSTAAALAVRLGRIYARALHELDQALWRKRDHVALRLQRHIAAFRHLQPILSDTGKVPPPSNSNN